ncbi:protein N-terminal asparagine amidohydrolase-like [Schistocerca nitens]|uniref:protein N-terminal asparagine amidohydrolase-like n=1 Tax=Schistocerca nitens TaxID=7011 RepID=UPI0021177323|nr:protein N-terminal asparagine amidohydrolase-like [Schistocerca nitens]XP_049801660.1 protein N-terminal asparagine amidohydrolase-like [Schistocerca nitens]XP_049801661.1 protein N-terminal asparagine amidohydrolase-like [Schistocerca nitens]XP_049801662.1 protein N-terminal asparagine amidohydrolase-like [Schistocerca nitens]
MVLVFNGVVQNAPPPNLHAFLQTNPEIREQSEKFLEIPTKTVGPHGLLYVHQGELAVTEPNDSNVEVLGSDDATTCIIAVLRHPVCGAVALSHMDGGGVADCVARMIESVKQIAGGSSDGKMELQVFGAFGYAQNFSETVFDSVMITFHKHPEKVNVTLACVGDINTTVKDGKHWPSLYGVGINVKTGELFPAVYKDRGPDEGLRHARQLCSKLRMMEVYNNETRMLKIGPFDYSPLNDAEMWLNLPDEVILHYMSTSPEVEPPHFVSQIRKALKCMLDHPSPINTIFKFNKPRCYVRDETNNGWVLVKK